MKRTGLLFILLPLVILQVSLAVDNGKEITHRFLKGGWNSGSVAVISAAGQVERSYKVDFESSDCWYLPDGGIVYSISNHQQSFKAGMIRLGADGKELWRYECRDGRDNHSCAPIAGGGFLMGQSAVDGAWMVEVDKDGKEVKEVPVKIDWGKKDVDIHHTFRQVRKTPEGNYIAAVFRLGKTFEWDKNGKLVRTFPKGVYVSIRLPNGNTLCTANAGKDGAEPLVIEYDKDGKVVWELGEKDLPFPQSMVCGIQRLPNGNTVVSNVPHGRNGKVAKQGPQLFEVTPDKKIVWQFKDWQLKNTGSFQIIDTNGVMLKNNEIYR